MISDTRRPTRNVRTLLIPLLILSTFFLPWVSHSGLFVAGVRDTGQMSASSLRHDMGQTFLVGRVEVKVLPPLSKQDPSVVMAYASLPDGKRVDGMQSRASIGASAVPPASPSSCSGCSSVIASTGFEGLVQFQSCGCYPPDVQVAAGPNNVVEMVNIEGAVFSKQGVLNTTFGLSSFFKTGTDFISDPKILFDSQSNRWFASVLDVDNPRSPTRSAIVLAVSTSSSPSTWNVFNIVTGPVLPDQPIIGVDDDKLVASANIYASTGFAGAQYFVVNKSDLEAGASNPHTSSFGPFRGLESVHPVHSLSSTTTEFMVTVGAGDLGSSSGSVIVIAITGVPGVSTVGNSSVTVGLQSIATPPRGLEPDPCCTINPDDFRVVDAAWFQGKLWFGLNDACIPSGDAQTRSCIRLAQISTSNFLKLQDFDFGASAQYFYYPALRIDSLGNLDLVYGFSSLTIYPSLAVTGQGASDPAGSLVSSVLIKRGSTSDTTGRNGFGPRYGDYFGASLDPSDQTVVWVAGEYNNLATMSCGAARVSCWSTFIDAMSFLDFNVTASPVSSTLRSGTTASASISLTSLNGFSGNVSLSTSTNPISGLTVMLSSPSLSLGAGQVVSTNVTFSSSTPGTYTVTLTGTSVPRFHSIQLTVKAVGFTISTTSPVYLASGNSNSSVIRVSSVNGFAGIVVLGSAIWPVASGAPAVALSATTLRIASGGSNSSLLTVTTTTSSLRGIYTVNVTGTSGSEVHSVYTPVVITPINFTVNNVTTFTGVTVTTRGSLFVSSPSTVLAIAGTIPILAVNASTGSTMFSTAYNVTQVPIKGNVLSYFSLTLLNIPIAPYALGSRISITFAGNATTLSIRVIRNADINGNGIVDQQDYNTVVAARGCSVGNPCYNPRADLDASGRIDLIDVAIVNSLLGSQNFMPNFGISANPSSVSWFTTSPSGSSTITLNSINGFTGTVSLRVSIFRNGLAAPFPSLQASLNPANVTLTANGTVQATLSMQSGVNANYLVSVTATSGPISQNVSITVVLIYCPHCT